MGLLSKIKNALFEEEIVEEPQIVKKIESTTKEQPVINTDVIESEHSFEYKKDEEPIIFDVEDFIEEEKKEEYQEPLKEEKILYGGYEVREYEKVTEKEKFHPSPIISPVYGIVDKEYKKETPVSQDKKSIDRLFVDEKRKSIDFDTVRQKAYGYGEERKEEVAIEKEQNLLYEMQEDDKPGIEKISLGDAEEYFEDLGLEYNVDYTDLAKEKMTRSKKNKELTEVVEEEIKETNKIEKELAPQQVKQPELEEGNTQEEKNLYDLIDMMYEEK